MTMPLPAALVATHAAFAVLEAKMLDLQTAERHGNLDRIGNAAFDIGLAALEIAKRADAIVALASQTACERYDANYRLMGDAA